MKKCLLLLLCLGLALPALACDPKDPVCVATMLYEKGATFRHKELKDYYCLGNEITYAYGVKASEVAVEELKKKDINYYAQEYHDFSKLTYDPVRIDQDAVVVKVSGPGIVGFKGTGIEHAIEVDTLYFLTKDPDSGNYCLPKNGVLRGTVKKRPQAPKTE